MYTLNFDIFIGPFLCFGNALVSQATSSSVPPPWQHKWGNNLQRLLMEHICNCFTSEISETTQPTITSGKTNENFLFFFKAPPQWPKLKWQKYYVLYSAADNTATYAACTQHGWAWPCRGLTHTEKHLLPGKPCLFQIMQFWLHYGF